MLRAEVRFVFVRMHEFRDLNAFYGISSRTPVLYVCMYIGKENNGCFSSVNNDHNHAELN